MLENLKSSCNLIDDEDLESSYRWIIIDSPKTIEKPVKIDTFFRIFPLSFLNLEELKEESDNQAFKEFINRLSFLKNFQKNVNKNYFLLEAKLPYIYDNNFKKKYRGFSIKHVIDDLLNILSLYYNKYFSFFPTNVIDFKKESLNFENIKSRTLEESELDPSSKDVSKNLKVMVGLRLEQFYLIQKSMSLYHQCLQTYEVNPSIALCFLISAIETLSGKYIQFEENWEDYSHLSFYQGLKKSLKKVSDKDLNNSLFNEIGKKYLKDAFLVKAKFQKFLLKHAGKSYRFLEDANDKKFLEILSDFYELRSNYMHSGKPILFSNLNQPIVYNRSKKGKIKTFNEGSRLDVRVLPSFQKFSSMIKNTILNFIDYLYIHRNNPSDENKYNQLDSKLRGVIEVVAKKDVKAGTVVYDDQIDRKPQYIDLVKNNARLQELIKKKDDKNLIGEYQNILKSLNNSNKDEDPRRICICHCKIGYHLLNTDNFKEAFDHLKSAEEISINNDFNDLTTSIIYNIACYHSLCNEIDDSLSQLEKIIQESKFRRLAAEDPHLKNVRNDPRYNSLLKYKT